MRRALREESNFDESEDLDSEDLDMELIKEQTEVFSNDTFSALGDGDSRVLLSIEPSSLKMPVLSHNFAITQSWRCAKKAMVAATIPTPGAQLEGSTNQVQMRKNIWRDCDKTQNPPDEMSVMGYSMRTMEFRYTIGFISTEFKQFPLWTLLHLQRSYTITEESRWKTLLILKLLTSLQAIVKPRHSKVRLRL